MMPTPQVVPSPKAIQYVEKKKELATEN